MKGSDVEPEDALRKRGIIPKLVYLCVYKTKFGFQILPHLDEVSEVV
jgi:hypothetical protein